MIFSIESFTADTACKSSSLAVYQIVSNEFEFGIKSLVTEVAGKGKLASVREDVLTELARAREAFIAGAADVALGAVAAGAPLALGRRALFAAGRQCGHSPRRLDGAETLLDAAGARGAQRHV